MKHEDFKVLIRARVSDAMSLVWVDLQLVRFLGLDQGVYQNLGVFEVNVFVNEPMDNQEPIFATKNRNQKRF